MATLGWIVLVGALLFGTHLFWMPLLGRFLVVSDPLEPADAVLSLAGEPRRAAYAADLVREGYARWFLITPLPLATQQERDVYVRQVRAIALRRGVPEGAILRVPTTGDSTYQEAENVRAFLETDAEARGIRSLLVVTSPWHTRRSKIIFRRVFRGSPVSFGLLPLPDYLYGYRGHTYRPEEWWTYRLGREPTVSEYLKLAAYFLGAR